jgi:hypothetical protein
MRKNDEQHPPKVTRQRLDAVLKGAFAGPPTKLKEIPTRFGGERGVKRSRKRSAK